MQRNFPRRVKHWKQRTFSLITFIVSGSVTSEASYQYQNGNLISTSGVSKNFEMIFDYIKPYEFLISERGCL